MTDFIPDLDDDSVICGSIYIHTQNHTDSGKMADLEGNVPIEMYACSKEKHFSEVLSYDKMAPHLDPIIIIKARTHHNSI
jgi:hypothetical protein